MLLLLLSVCVSRHRKEHTLLLCCCCSPFEKASGISLFSLTLFVYVVPVSFFGCGLYVCVPVKQFGLQVKASPISKLNTALQLSYLGLSLVQSACVHAPPFIILRFSIPSSHHPSGSPLSWLSEYLCFCVCD